MRNYRDRYYQESFIYDDLKSDKRRYEKLFDQIVTNYLSEIKKLDNEMSGRLKELIYNLYADVNQKLKLSYSKESHRDLTTLDMNVILIDLLNIIFSSYSERVYDGLNLLHKKSDLLGLLENPWWANQPGSDKTLFDLNKVKATIKRT